MEVQIRIPSPPQDFNFLSGRSSPCSDSSTPRAFGDHLRFLSAPASPSRVSEFYDEIYETSSINGGEEGSSSNSREDMADFAFHVSTEAEKPSASAEDLFDGGIIRTLNDPVDEPQSEIIPPVVSPKSSKSIGKKSFWSVFTPKRMRNTNGAERPDESRGREKVSPPSKSSSVVRGARSVSPGRVSKYPWEDEKKAQQDTKQTAPNSKPSSSSALTLSTPSKSSKRWKLKDLLLFRSASEGRAADKDPLRRFTTLNSKQEEARSSSFRAVNSSSRRRAISAHERHYTQKKAASEDMKKKTFLPYKQGILGLITITPAVQGFGSFPAG